MPDHEKPTPARASSRRGPSLHGTLLAPGDKSVSHRALIMAALARGTSQISGLLQSDDVLATAGAMQALGARIHPPASEGAPWRITGCAGQWMPPAAPLDFGNSGTGARLTMGAVAGVGVPAVFTGDESLSVRPMRRVLDPLAEMGANSRSNEGCLPVALEGGALRGIDYTPPVASAQVKSAILLAALGAAGETIVREHRLTRNHTETMFGLFGVDIESGQDGAGAVIRMSGPQSLSATDLTVPGDPSSAAFATIAALINPGSDITIRNVMANPARTGLYKVLDRMGADIRSTSAGEASGEMISDLQVKASALRPIDLEAEIAPDLIDEYPILAVACATASGVSRLRGLAELRAKESDRLTATWSLLTANGVTASIEGDDLIIEGGGDIEGGASVATEGDHRIAMASLVLGTVSKAAVTIDQAGMIATSYPDFIRDMKALGAMIEPLA